MSSKTFSHHIKAVTTLVDCHYCNSSSTSFVAYSEHPNKISPSNLIAHIFKTATQSTFYNYLTAYRFDKALELLLHSDKKIIDVAQECGFSNTSSFNRSFKNFFSKTPSEYIKENLQMY